MSWRQHRSITEPACRQGVQVFAAVGGTVSVHNYWLAQTLAALASRFTGREFIERRRPHEGIVRPNGLVSGLFLTTWKGLLLKSPLGR